MSEIEGAVNNTASSEVKQDVIADEEIHCVEVQTRAKKAKEGKPHKPLKFTTKPGLDIGPEQLIEQQKTDQASSSSSGASLTGHSRLHELTPLGTFLRTLPRQVEAEIVLLEVELNRSKPGSSWSTRRALPVPRQTTDSCS